MRRKVLKGMMWGLALAVVLAAAPAGADDRRRPSRRWVPEFDPATAGAIATLLVGGGVLVARRRR